MQASTEGHIAAQFAGRSTGRAPQPLLVTVLAGTTAATAIRRIPHRPHRLTELATAMGRITAVTAIRATLAHLTIPALLSASGGVTRVEGRLGLARADEAIE